MKTVLRRVSVLVMVLVFAGAIPVRAEKPTRAPAVLTLPATGTFELGGEFTGTISINRFEQRGNQVVAIGVVAGVLTQGGRKLGTAVVGEVAWPVALRSGGQLIANSRTLASAPRPRQIAWSSGLGSAFRVLPVQAAGCQVLDIALGPITLDVLGVDVALGAVTFNLTGVAGTPLGDLVCAVSDLLGNVAGLVNVLNSLLGLITGLLGGLVGAIPVP